MGDLNMRFLEPVSILVQIEAGDGAQSHGHGDKVLSAHALDEMEVAARRNIRANLLTDTSAAAFCKNPRRMDHRPDDMVYLCSTQDGRIGWARRASRSLNSWWSLPSSPSWPGFCSRRCAAPRNPANASLA